MKSITLFKVSKDKNIFTAEGVELPIVTEAGTLDELVKNIQEAVHLYFENEDLPLLDYKQKPVILLNYELPQYA